MYIYILGLALLYGGFATFTKSMSALDNTPTLLSIRFIGGAASLIFFIIGFFIFNWWVPIIGILLSLLLWMIINTIAFKSQSFSIFIAMRSQISILFGIILCLFGLLN